MLAVTGDLRGSNRSSRFHRQRLLTRFATMIHGRIRTSSMPTCFCSAWCGRCRYPVRAGRRRAHQGGAVRAWCDAGYRGSLENDNGCGQDADSDEGVWQCSKRSIASWCQSDAFSLTGLQHSVRS